MIELIVKSREDRTTSYRLPDGTRHRIDGPAIEYDDGSWAWFYKGDLHKVNGPALFNSEDNEYYFYVEDQRYEFDDWCYLLDKTEAEIAVLILEYIS